MPVTEPAGDAADHPFFEPWLDAELMGSAGRWEQLEGAGDGGRSDGDVLDAAQAAMMAWVIGRADVHPGARVLDVDCGWGGALRRLSSAVNAVECLGATGNGLQIRFCREVRPHPSVRVTGTPLGDIDDGGGFDLVMALDGCVPDDPRDFFATCRPLLRRSGVLVLQGLVSGRRSARAASDRQSGPRNSSLLAIGVPPSLSALATAWDPYFSLSWYDQASDDGLRTVRSWAARLGARRDLIGSREVPATYDRLSERLSHCNDQLRAGVWSLARMVLRPRRRTKTGGAPVSR